MKSESILGVRMAHKYWCHMTSDVSEQELHEFAQALGLLRAWFQAHPTHPHYDVTPKKRALALLHGAVEVSSLELLQRCYAIRRKADNEL